MSKAAFIRRGNAFYPVDDDGAAIVAACPEGKEVMGDLHPVRNVRHHRMFFGLLKLLVENTDMFGSIDDALMATKIACREVDTYIEASTGQVFYIPRSIKFESMDQARFRRLFERALHVITTRWLIGTDAEDLRQQVYDIVDGPAAIGRRAA